MTAIGATSVGVTAVRNDLKLLTIINIGSTIILWWSLLINYEAVYRTAHDCQVTMDETMSPSEGQYFGKICCIQ